MIPSWPTTETTSETCSSTQETRCSASPSSVTSRRAPQSSQNRALGSFRHRRHFMEASRSWLVYRTDRRVEIICAPVWWSRTVCDRTVCAAQDLNTVADRARLDGLAAGVGAREQAANRRRKEATMRIRGGIPAVVVMALAATAGTTTPGAAQDKTLTIGVLGPPSGGAASYGVELVRGAEMRAEEINKGGGLKVGSDVYRIKPVSYDHKALDADAASAANKLVFQDKVKYIIGNAAGATCNAVQTVTEPEKVLFAFVCWGTSNLGPDKPHSFRAMLSQWEVAEPFYRWVKD